MIAYISSPKFIIPTVQLVLDAGEKGNHDVEEGVDTLCDRPIKRPCNMVRDGPTQPFNQLQLGSHDHKSNLHLRFVFFFFPPPIPAQNIRQGFSASLLWEISG